MHSNMKSVLRNYIQNCGEGRGLQKFLRRNSFSSDERETSSPIETIRQSKTKSLECLNEVINKKEEKLQKSPPKEKSPQKDIKEPKPMEGAKVVVKQTGEKTDKKKSFNYESVIEITIPPQQSFMPLPITVPEISKDITFDEKVEEPIKPIICTPKSSKIPPHRSNSDKKISPSSGNDDESFVSNKQNPMEWDDFIPGYETEVSQIENTSIQLCNNPMELNDCELSALKTYFHQRGLELPNENLIVVIKNRHEKVLESENKTLEHIRKNKEKWQNIYEKYRDKYRSQQQQSTINFEEVEAQSTPKIPEIVSEKYSKLTVMNEKGSQTSLVRSSAKSIQVEAASIKKSQTKNATILSVKESRTENASELYRNPSEIAESFEFVHGSKSKESVVSSKDSSKSKKSTSIVTEAGSSKNSVISESLRNEEVTSFDDSLKVAIALLSSLLDSNMRPELKRNLAEKVIQKIVQLQTSRSIQTSTIDESSALYVQSNSSKIHSDMKSAKEKKCQRSKSREDALKDCLGPMTKSEQSHQNSRSDDSTTKSNDENMAKKTQLMDFMKREKQSQLKWIEKEIEHLNNLRDLLKKNESTASINENCPIYENLSTIKSNKETENKDINVWNSHVKMKKVKNRQKLEIPQSDPNVSQSESLASFINSRNKKFIENYSQHQKKLYEEANAYTQPKSHNSKKISEKCPQVRQTNRRTQLTANKDVQTSTSLASSSVFESSGTNSMSAENYQMISLVSHPTETNNNKNRKKNNRGTSQEQKQKVAITQTTDSICRTKPIYEASNKYETTSTTTTKRVQKIQNDKQLQAHPPPVKYTLTFDKKSKPKMRPYSSLPQKPNDYGTISKSSKDIYNQISYSASLNYHCDENKENYDNDVLFDTNDDEEDVDLQNCFNKKRPEIFSRFEQRKKCIEELRKLRALRNEHRAKLLLLTSEKSLEGKLFSSLPELPLKTTRIFSTKALKLQTKKVVRNLHEVQQKKKEENIKNLKKKTRLMTEIFNRNLQRNVLKGNLNLSNTVNLITK